MHHIISFISLSLLLLLEQQPQDGKYDVAGWLKSGIALQQYMKTIDALFAATKRVFVLLGSSSRTLSGAPSESVSFCRIWKA